MKGDNQYQKYIILAWYRTGSNLIVNLLSSHPSIIAYSELFHPPEIFWGEGVFGLSQQQNDQIIETRNKKTDLFLDKYVFRKYPAYIEAVGFKVLYPHFNDKRYKGLKKILLSSDDLKIIHLKRRDLLQVYVSKELAAKRRIMNETSSKRAYQNLLEIGKLYCPIENVESFFIDHSKRVKEYDDLLVSNKVLEVYYEDLVKNIQLGMKNVQDYLCVKQKKLNTVLVKQNVLSLQEIIANFLELSEYFKGTEWEFFFNR